MEFSEKACAMNSDELVRLVKQAGVAYSKGELQLALHLYERAVLID
uniref:Uncharacterized protein n=1 Tax=Ascaris lumbricoides TaxID=6252 RepID=A0A9J2Q3E0_ASCLU